MVWMLAAAIGIASLVWWQAAPAMRLAKRLPGADDPTGRKARQALEAQTKIGQFFERGVERPAATSGSWSRFRGDDFSNIRGDSVVLGTNWPAARPPILWSIDLGEGHASPAVRNGRVYILDYDDKKGRDSLRCFSFEDGAEIWARSYKVQLKRNHGMSRTVPAVTDKYIVTIGPKCHVMCVDTPTGDFRWGLDLPLQFGTTVPGWYTGQCPLIDDGVAIIAPAGTNVLMLAIDCETGKTAWSVPNKYKAQMSHSSIIPMKIGERRMFVYSAVGVTLGVAADGEDRGTVLWQTTEWNPSVIAPSPLLLNDGRILLCAGYGAGSMTLQVIDHNGTFSVRTVSKNGPKEGISSEQQTPLFYKNHIYTVHTKDAGQQRNQLACYSADGAPVWTSGKAHTFGLGPYIIAGGRLIVMDDEGNLTFADASPAGFKPFLTAKILDGHDSWGPLVFVDGKLLARDLKKMVCLDLRTDRNKSGKDVR